MERYPVSLDVECEGYSGRFPARITDLNRFGAYVDTLKPFPPGSNLSLIIPKKEGNKLIKAKAEVRHSRDGMGMGLEFQDLDSATLEAIEALYRRRVLVADDDETYRTFLKLLFEKRGYIVRLAKDGQEAMELATDEAFDLVVTDGLMPRMHGFELSRMVKSLPNNRRTKVIVMTAIYRSDSYRCEATQKFQADDYLKKPFHVEEIMKKVNALLEN
jgi:CheY-like chemotaxis protein